MGVLHFNKWLVPVGHDLEVRKGLIYQSPIL
jgi:hypothetical protein